MYDKESGLYYYNQRYYDPHLGSFVNPDPAMEGLNHYSYCNANPIIYSDPTGMYQYNEDYDICYDDGSDEYSTYNGQDSNGNYLPEGSSDSETNNNNDTQKWDWVYKNYKNIIYKEAPYKIKDLDQVQQDLENFHKFMSILFSGNTPKENDEKYWAPRREALEKATTPEEKLKVLQNKELDPYWLAMKDGHCPFMIGGLKVKGAFGGGKYINPKKINAIVKNVDGEMLKMKAAMEKADTLKKSAEAVDLADAIEAVVSNKNGFGRVVNSVKNKITSGFTRTLNFFRGK